jgi:hypothetical protein
VPDWDSGSGISSAYFRLFISKVNDLESGRAVEPTRRHQNSPGTPAGTQHADYRCPRACLRAQSSRPPPGLVTCMGRHQNRNYQRIGLMHDSSSQALRALGRRYPTRRLRPFFRQGRRSRSGNGLIALPTAGFVSSSRRVNLAPLRVVTKPHPGVVLVAQVHLA